MGLRSGLPHLGSPRRCVADLAAPIQLAPAAQQSKIKSAHQPPRSYRGQPVEAPQLADGRLASGGGDGQIKIWPKDGRGEPVVLAHGRSVGSLAVLPGGRLASASLDGLIKLWPKDSVGEPLVFRQGAAQSGPWQGCLTG